MPLNSPRSTEARSPWSTGCLAQLLRHVALCTCLCGCTQQIDWVAVSASPDASLASCSGDIPSPARATCERISDTFSTPLCTCEDFTGSAPLTVHSTTMGVPDTRIDGALSLSASADIAGTLTVAGERGLDIAPGQQLRVSDSLDVGGDLAATGTDIIVGRHARIAGNVAASSLRVEGRLTLPASNIITTDQAPESNETLRGSVQIVAACNCAGTPPPAPVEPVTTATIDNRVPLCGARHTPGLATDGTLSIEGSGTLVIDGDVHIGGDLDFVPSSDADIFIWLSGNLTVRGQLNTQTALHSGRVHLLIAGFGTLELGGGAFHGSITAPNAELVVSGPLDMTGAMLVRRANISAPLTIQHAAPPVECGLP